MLTITNLALRRGPHLLLSGATAGIQAGDRCGLIGANGCGKSTLLAAVIGYLEPDSGDIQLTGRPVIAHVAQHTPADPRPAIDYVMDGDRELRDIQHALLVAEQRNQGEQIALLHGQLESIDGYGAEARAARLMHGLGFAPGQEHAPVNSLSGGWRMRLNLAQALMCRSDLLLLDEPTNHLDLDAVIWLQNWLEGYTGGLLLISHDRDFLDQVTNRILHIEGGRLHLYSGNYAAFERQRLARLEQQQDAYRRQQAEIAHIQSFIDRFRVQANKARQAQSRIKALQRMELVAPVDASSHFRFAFRQPQKLPNPLLRMENVDCGYGETAVLRTVAMSLSPGDRIGLLGRNGAGKSTLVRTLAGTLPALGGDRVDAQDLRIGYFAQHQLEQLDPDASPLLHLQRQDPLATDQALRNFLGGFGFSGDMATGPVRPFSGGERARLALALLVYRRPNLLLLDEPTNHLDLDMRDALALALQDFPGAIIVIAHDRHLLRSTVDRLFLVSAGHVGEFDGDLDDYARWLTTGARTAQSAVESAPPLEDDMTSAAGRKEQRRQEAERRQALRPLRKEVHRLEKQMEQAQARLHDLEQALTDPELYTDASSDRLQDLLQEQTALTRELAHVEETWIDAMDRLESAESTTAMDS